MMAERSEHVDHATINRWVVKFSHMLASQATPQETRRQELADGRDLHQGPRTMLEPPRSRRHAPDSFGHQPQRRVVEVNRAEGQPLGIQYLAGQSAVECHVLDAYGSFVDLELAHPVDQQDRKK